MTSPFALAAAHLSKRHLLAIAFAIALIVVASLGPAQSVMSSKAERVSAAKPTIVLVHGAWADASSWTRVIQRLHADGYQVRALANPLRTLSGDAAYVRGFLETVPGPVILVAHSYGGAVITNAATGLPNVRALVYINAFAPDEGEDATSLAGPDSALSVPDPTSVFDLVPPTLPPTATTDLYLKRSTVFKSFATGLSAKEKAVVWATQRGAAIGALGEPSGVPAWKTTPSWYLLGLEDLIIPRSVQKAMAVRAGSTIVKYGAGHLGLMTAPGTVARVIERAAAASVH